MQLGWSRILVLGAFALAACSDSGPDEGTPQDFTGSYTLVSFSLGGVDVPGASGTITMTATNYTASLTVPPAPAVSDHGTYTATGTTTSGTWTQQSTDNPTLQYVGTYTFDSQSNRLTLDTTAQAIHYVLVLQKT